MSTFENSVVVLPGGIWQAEMIRFLKGKHHCVYVVNPVSNSATELADTLIQCDIKNISYVYSSIKSKVVKPLLITSDQCDIACAPVSILCQKFGLERNELGAVNRFSSCKTDMYGLASAIGVPVLPYQQCEDVQQVEAFFKLMGQPIVVKPDDSTNSRGFRVISSFEDIKASYEYTVRFSTNSRVVAQKFFPSGEQITVEGFCQNGSHINLCSSSKGSYWTASLTSSLCWPARVPNCLMDKIMQANDLFVHSAGLRFGITHAEYILDTSMGEFWFNEIACRGGGFRIGREIIKIVTGFDTYEQLYNILIGDPKPLVKPVAPQRAAILQFYSRDEMSMVSREKAMHVQAIPGVFDFSYDFASAAYLTDQSNIRHTYGIYEGDDWQQCKDILAKVEAYLK